MHCVHSFHSLLLRLARAVRSPSPFQVQSDLTHQPQCVEDSLPAVPVHSCAASALCVPTPQKFRLGRSFLALRGFTLVELLVAMAIVALLAAIALPAYNNYALKSRFSEVVAATNPTKTGIAACVASGDCVSNGTVFLGSQPSTTNLSYTTALTAANTSLAAIYAAAYAIRIIVSHDTPAQAAATAQSFVQSQINAQPSYYAVVSTTSDGRACLISYSQYIASTPTQCSANTPTLAQVNSYMNADINPYYASSAVYTQSSAPLADIPCVGGAGCSPSTKYASIVSYDTNGVITATASSSFGLGQETFILTPSYSSGRLDWLSSGSCKTRSSGAIC